MSRLRIAAKKHQTDTTASAADRYAPKKASRAIPPNSGVDVGHRLLEFRNLVSQAQPDEALDDLLDAEQQRDMGERHLSPMLHPRQGHTTHHR